MVPLLPGNYQYSTFLIMGQKEWIRPLIEKMHEIPDVLKPFRKHRSGPVSIDVAILEWISRIERGSYDDRVCPSAFTLDVVRHGAVLRVVRLP